MSKLREPHATRTCRCSHAGMWHKPDCRIRDCECEGFEWMPAVRQGSFAGTTALPRTNRKNRGPLT